MFQLFDLSSSSKRKYNLVKERFFLKFLWKDGLDFARDDSQKCLAFKDMWTVGKSQKKMGDDRVLKQYITHRIDSEVPASHAEK